MESAQYPLISEAEVTTLPPDHNVIQALDPDQLAHFTKPLSLLVLFRLSFSPRDAVDDLQLLGFKIWNGYGRIESPLAGFISRGDSAISEIKPE